MTDNVATSSICELAALYTLAALDEDERRRFEAHLLDGCTSCDADLAENAAVVAMLGLAAAPVEPPRALRDRLLAATAPPAAHPDLSDVGDWRPLDVPGVFGRVLHVDHPNRTLAMLVRADAGARYPRHRHAAVEEMFMISGHLAIGASEYGPGAYIRSEADSVHAPGRTLGGCMFLIRTSLDDEVLPPSENDEAFPAYER